MRPAECLKGVSLADGWKAIDFIVRPSTATGGAFSVGYLVEHETGRSAYMKALDFAQAMQSKDPSRALQVMTALYNFERDLLNACKDKKLNRVVTPIADGVVDAPGNHGPIGRVSYLIFDLAHGDVRSLKEKGESFEMAWSLRSLHHCAVGLRQLHQSGIAHQDLKPSNVLLFGSIGTKIADLGRASSTVIPSPIDELQIPGDIGYAPPELRYGPSNSRTFQDRCLADLYLLGSLIYFHFTGMSINQAILAKSSSPAEAHSYGESLEQDLPYLQQKFADVLSDLQVLLADTDAELSHPVTLLIRHLCEPDPHRRSITCGHRSLKKPLNLERIVSNLDLMATKAENRIK